ncbi:cytochrome P450 [Sphingomonas sp. G-3-2-10]|uniref:cytochrome P450 n=1 Tax=Sphingomonas sp. G-3-2-10 TaxID=2728838 RepID=UPI001469FC72|nr:cytochrome P450 [Sphingomonas sp. G-3-2-10]NML04367.1 cytochrome P450 [Sphingomonas sp. G-3-2-10]
MSNREASQDFDPLQPEVFGSAHEDYARLRRECPVAHTDAWGGFWALMRYDDVKRAASDAKTYITSVQNVVPRVAFTGRRPPLHLDPPEHTPYRRALNPLLSMERSEALVETTRVFVTDLLDPMVAKGGGDVCEEFASHLPVQVFGAWMKMPDDLLGTLHEAGQAFIMAVRSAQPDSMKVTSLRLYEMARDLIERRKATPMDPVEDPTSALLAARDANGDRLPDEMILGTVRQVLVVGIVAPTVLMGSIAVHLSRDPELQSRLRADRLLVPAALEEFLRLYSPYRGFARTATCPVTLHGRTIPEGDPIALVYASANRDESVFPDGGAFVMDRPNIAEHLAFGRGPHNCPGVHLGRMQLRVALEELLARTSGFELAGEPVVAPFPEIGAISVPLRFL